MVTERSYELRCLDCGFVATINGDTYDVLDVIDDHRKENRNDTATHFVEFTSEGASLQQSEGDD